jgi:hypothetical protein
LRNTAAKGSANGGVPGGQCAAAPVVSILTGVFTDDFDYTSIEYERPIRKQIDVAHYLKMGVAVANSVLDVEVTIDHDRPHLSQCCL